MKNFWKYIIRNLSNIFGLIGIILTLYFGVFYVPSWLKKAQNEKVLNAQKNLEQSIKELVFSDSICNYSEISILIDAKILELNEPFPLEPKEVLTKIQESFMQDRFLPLDKRKELIFEIENLKKQVPINTEIDNEKIKNDSISTTLKWTSILGSILSVIIGIISFYLKFKTEKAKDEEIENQIIETDNQKDNVELAFEYEKQIIKIISNYKGVDIVKTSEKYDFGFDLEFNFNKKKYFIEVKYLTQSKIGLKSFHRFLSRQKGLEGQFWFIYNTDLTDMVKNRAENMNKLTFPHREIVLIKAENELEFKKQLDKLLHTTMYN